jgi:hypothetical protein
LRIADSNQPSQVAKSTVADEIASEINQQTKQAQSNGSPSLALAEKERQCALEIRDKESLKAWLIGQSPYVASAIAVRTLLRAAPLAGVFAPVPVTPGRAAEFAELIATIFRVMALARTVAKYPSRAREVYNAIDDAVRAASTCSAGKVAIGSPAHAAIRIFDVARETAQAAECAAWVSVVTAELAAIRVSGGNSSNSHVQAAFASAAASDAAAGTAAAVAAAREEVGDATKAAAAACGYAWAEIHADAIAIATSGATATSDLPIWSKGIPLELFTDWNILKYGLPNDQNWDVWIEWYEERLRGGSLGEARELVFATVPETEWDRGPAAANAWIKAHLP